MFVTLERRCVVWGGIDGTGFTEDSYIVREARLEVLRCFFTHFVKEAPRSTDLSASRLEPAGFFF